jgi:proline dehydrogenase
MLDAISKALFHTLAGSALLQKAASRYGMAGPTGLARRFVAGESLDDAADAARALQAKGFSLTLDLLGESVANLDEADVATRGYLEAIQRVVDAGIERNLSVKLTQLGLDVDRAVCTDNLRRILGPAGKQAFFVRLDMERSTTVQTTLDIFTTLWQQEYRNMGVVLQSALYRSEGDLERMNALGARVRLVKGAYKEPKAVAHQKKADVDAAYRRMMQRLLSEGTHPAIATHDPAIIDETKRYAAERGIERDRFEFQMLYGVRRDLQAALLADGYRMRIYVPFGGQWFPYLLRRLGERPANLAFLVSGVAREARADR